MHALIKPVTSLKEDEKCGLDSEIDGQDKALMSRSTMSSLSIWGMFLRSIKAVQQWGVLKYSVQ